jgi:hypothetical protein
MTKKLIACGCSFTIDNYQNTWPNFLSEELNVELINIAARGAGLDFISKRLITYISKNKQADISVAVMLPSADRFDLYVDEGNPQKIDFLNISGWQGGKHQRGARVVAWRFAPRRIRLCARASELLSELS